MAVTPQAEPEQKPPGREIPAGGLFAAVCLRDAAGGGREPLRTPEHAKAGFARGEETTGMRRFPVSRRNQKEPHRRVRLFSCLALTRKVRTLVGPRTAGRRVCAVQAFRRRRNLGGGRIHFARAFQIPTVTIKITTPGRCGYFYGGAICAKSEPNTALISSREIGSVPSLKL